MSRLSASLGFLFVVTTFGVGSLVACSGDPAQPSGGGPEDDGGASDTDSGSDTDAGNQRTDSGTNPAQDAGGDSGPSGGCTDHKFCENFESYSGAIANNMAVGPWKASVAGVTMAIDTTKHAGGAKSLKISVPAGATAHGLLSQAAMPAGIVDNNNVYGRVMVFYSALPASVHSWLFNAQGKSTAANGDVAMNMGTSGATGTPFQLNYHPPAPATEQSVRGDNLTAGKWLCVRWQYDGSGTKPKDEGKVWIGSSATPTVDAKPTLQWDFATPWSAFQFGFQHYQTLANAIDVYIDDFALDNKPIACP